MVHQDLLHSVHPSLSTLPPDIIRIIIKLVAELGFPIEKLRLVGDFPIDLAIFKFV